MLDPVNEAKAIGSTVVWYVVLGALLLISIGIGWALKPVMYKADRAAIKNSHQYIESNITKMQKNILAYREAQRDIDQTEASDHLTEDQKAKLIDGLTNQQRALLSEVQESAARLSEDDLTPDIKRFLAEHNTRDWR